MSGRHHQVDEDPGDRYRVGETDEFHPDWLEVRDGVNYVAGWRAASAIAQQIRTLLAHAGVQTSPGTLWASVRGDGTGVICVDPSIAAALAQLADEALRERQEGAPKIRGAPRD
jgi:hypothetical protein